SASLTPRLEPPDVPESGCKCGIGIERGGIELERIGSALQRGGSALPVARVTKHHILQNALVYSGAACCLQLFESPQSSGFDRGRQEDLGIRVRANDGPDIAPVEHGAGPPAGEIPLE